MQISLILPQIVALDVVFALAACLQTIHVPLIASRRSSYNRKVICAYEASLVLHLVISAVILFASSGSYLVAPLDVCAGAMGGALWLNAAIFAYGVVLMVHYRRPVMLAELLLVAAVTPPVVFALGSAWAVVLIAEGAFFLFRSIAALLMDVRNRQEDITAFSTIETINVIPVGILYLDSKGHPLLMNRCMRKNLAELHMPTDLHDMSGTWNGLRKLSAQMPESSKDRVRIDLDRFGETRAVVEVSPSEIRLFVCDDVMVSGRPLERIIGLDVTEYAHAHDRLAQANHLLIREASTNATKHAQAHRVHVRLWQERTDADAVAHMTISNDGSPAPVSYREGTGIPGMRHVAQDLGGSLEVHATPPFTLTVSIPLNANDTSQRRNS